MALPYATKDQVEVISKEVIKENTQDIVEQSVDAVKEAISEGEIDVGTDVEKAPEGTIVDVLGLDETGKVVKGVVGGGTKLYKHDLRFGTIYPQYALLLISTKKTLNIDTSVGTKSADWFRTLAFNTLQLTEGTLLFFGNATKNQGKDLYINTTRSQTQALLKFTYGTFDYVTGTSSEISLFERVDQSSEPTTNIPLFSYEVIEL